MISEYNDVIINMFSYHYSMHYLYNTAVVKTEQI